MVKYISKSKLPTVQRYNFNTQIKGEAQQEDESSTRIYQAKFVGMGLDCSHHAWGAVVNFNQHGWKLQGGNGDAGNGA